MDYYSTQVRKEEAQALRTRLGAFVEQHEQRLFDTQQRLRHPSDATHWSRPHDVVTAQLSGSAYHVSVGPHHQPRSRRQLQQYSTADVIGASVMTADPLLFRFSTTLTSLNAEMHALADEAHRCFAPPLALVGDENENCYRSSGAEATHGAAVTPGAGAPPPLSTAAGTAARRAAGVSLAGGSSGSGLSGVPSSEETEEVLREEQLLHRTGNLLSLLQSIWLWSQRVQEVCAHVVCQLACIYSGQTSRESPFQAVRLTSCWDTFGELLGAVVSVEEQLQQNASIRDGFEVMQRIVAQQTMEAEKHDAAGGDDDAEVLRLLLHRLQAELLDRGLLVAIAGQNFDRCLRAATSTAATDPKTVKALRSAGAAASSPAAMAAAAPPPPSFRENKALCAEWVAVLATRCRDFEAAVAAARLGEQKASFSAICGLSLLLQSLFAAPAPGGAQRSGGAGGAAIPVAAASVSKMATAELQRLTTQVLAWQSAAPLLPLHGLYALCPLLWWRRFFPGYASAAVASKKANAGTLIRESVMAACRAAGAQFLVRVTQQWSVQVERWAVVEMQTALPIDSPLCRQFVQRSVLLVQQGLLLAQSIREGVLELLALHHHAESALTTSMVSGVLKGVLLLQHIADAYHAKMGILATSQEAFVQSIAYAMEKHLYNLYTQACAESGGGGGESGSVAAPSRSPEQLIAFQGALQLLHKPITADSFICLALLLDVALNREQLDASVPPTSQTEQERDEVFIAFAQLKTMVGYQNRLPALTSTDFLYFYRESLFPLFFQECYRRPLLASSLPSVVAALMDTKALLLSAQHVPNPDKTLLAPYADFVRDCMHHELLQPLCTEIENQLRLGTHAVVLGQPYRVLRPSVDPVGRDLTRFTRLPPFRFLHDWVHVSAHVEHYLSTQFYNLNALMPNDWKTYEEMRNLAQRLYRLQIAESHLPGCILDQGLDVLVITENIDQFISYYTYNLNEQVFIQRPSLTSSKHLHTLNTRHIANSIRTHGTGVMNTAVNYVYKCLLKKMAILSHFLQDDYVRSHLLKDARLVRQRKKEHQPVKYASEQAERLQREMDRLGLAADGVSFLEKARHLIGEMGNALGFMRMMRSGGLRAVAEGARFVPHATAAAEPPSLRAYVTPSAPSPLPRASHVEDREDEESDGEDDASDSPVGEGGTATTAGAPPRQQLRRSTVDAVANLDHIIRSMLDQLSDGSEYFPLLLEAIGRRLRRSSAERYAHLHLLYLLIPALANLHVACAIQEKEKLLKKHNDEGVFSDDGFAVGATFLLVLFDVYEEFDALHWFDIKKAQHRQNLESVHGALASASASGSSEFDNLHLTSSALQMNLKEYTWLENAFTSSRLFFDTTSFSRSGVDGGDMPSRTPPPRHRRTRGASEADEEREDATVDDDDDEEGQEGDDAWE